MTLDVLAAFALGVFVLCASPGPGVATVVGRSLGSGLAAGLAVMLGILLGQIVFLSLAVIGAGALATMAEPVFRVVKFGGAGVLVWMGARRLSGAKAFEIDETQAGSLPRDAATGFLVTLGNPKPMVFFGALLPGLVDLRSVAVVETLTLFPVMTGMASVILGSYAALAARARTVMRSEVAMRRLNAATGAVFIAAGLAIALR